LICYLLPGFAFWSTFCLSFLDFFLASFLPLSFLPLSPTAFSFNFSTFQSVGRESEAHPAFSIIPSLDLERYHLPPIPGYKYHFERNDGSLNKANPQPSARDHALPDCIGYNQRGAHSHPRPGWHVPKSVAAKCLVLPSSAPR
jgi:hypothetical protein